jgi:hypothetical protein
MNDALNEGLDALMVFKKWARHPYMDKYERILEEWDDRVCKTWGPASKPFLSPDEWLMYNPAYKNRELKLRNYVNKAFKHVHKFFDNLDPILQSYWENQNIDFELIRNPKLLNPQEILEALIRRFDMHQEAYKEILPLFREIGMVKVNLQ